MKEHRYEVTTEWTGNQGQGTRGYQSYSRDHVISGAGKYGDILASSDPAFLGDKTRYNPEDLFLSSLSACHMLWYLHLCSSHGVAVTSYADVAVGVMVESKDQSGRFTKVTLHPEVEIEDADQIERARALHADAHRMCFIANSCNFPVEHEPTIKSRD